MGPDRPDRREEPAHGGGPRREMRIAVLGGTRFIGRAIVEELASQGHDLLVMHRGQLEPDDMPAVRHLHCDRSELLQHRHELDGFESEAAIDCRALTRTDAEIALQALPDVARWIVISSIDVYRAFGALHEDRETDPVPLDEESPVRPARYPYRGKLPGMDQYDKRDIAHAVRLALDNAGATGVMNLCEDRTYSMRMWVQMILEAAGSRAEVVRVGDDLLPDDLKET